MRFVFNGSGLQNGRVMGIQRNTIELLRQLDHMVDSEMIELVVSEDFKVEDVASFENIKVTHNHDVSCSGVRKMLWDHIFFTRYARRRKAIAVDSMLGLPLSTCQVVFLYDTIIEEYPEDNPGLKGFIRRRRHIFKVRHAVKSASLIVIDSDDALLRIRSWYHEAIDNVVVIPCAWQHFGRVKPNNGIIEKLGIVEAPFLFSLGSVYPHKNIRWIYEAARQNPEYTFVVTGSSEFYNYRDSMHLPNLVQTGYLTDSEVKALMGHCVAFLQPSFFEGFGIPPMEAMSVGAKCILANAGSLPAIYGELATYIDPYSYDEINIPELIAQASACNPVSTLEKYSWQVSAKKLLDAFATNFGREDIGRSGETQ